jgi:alpha,alpha-trehalose phosphorylase
VLSGFGGGRDHGGHLSFSPRLPEALSRICFRFQFRGRCIKVEIEHGQATYTLASGDPIEIGHHGESVELTQERSTTRPIPDPPEYETPVQPPGRAPARRRRFARTA